MPAVVITLLCALSVVACFPRSGSLPYVGRLPPDTHVDLRGIFTFSPAGSLTLALARPCAVEYASHQRVTSHKEEWASAVGLSSSSSVPCDRVHLDRIVVIATTPWHEQVEGIWTDASHLVFRVDWEDTGLDPLTPNMAAVVAMPWEISGTRWTPSANEARHILELIGAAKTEEVAEHGIPHLEITRFEASGGTLHAGGESIVVVGIANHGSETAYRVVAMTRSGISGLHGKHVDFGRIKPGIEKLRQLRLTVPSSETSPDAMLVLMVEEGNGFSPADVSRRMPIAPAPIATGLKVRCSIPGQSASRADLNAGDHVVIHCVVDNTGAGAANVNIETSISGEDPTKAPAQRIAPAGRASFDVPIAIPRELVIDSKVEIAITACDYELARSAHTMVVGVIRKPKLCAFGELTRAQYRAKLAELRTAVAAGNLTQSQFDRYDAELVTCLK
jgi:hypothetical protein